MADFQFIIAELSLALAGFSGVIVAITGNPGRKITEIDRFGLSHILLASGSAMLFSLAPLGLIEAGLPAAWAYGVNNTCLGAFVAVMAVRAAWASRVVTPRSPVSFWPLVLGGFVLGVLLLLDTAGVVEGDFLPLTLVWLLLVAFVQFYVFLRAQWQERAG